MKTVKHLIFTVTAAFFIGCGGGDSSCPESAPLECTTGGCCPRGYPYSCGNGLCYQFGCPTGSPQIGICELKLATSDHSRIETDISAVTQDEAGESVPESDPN